MASVTRSRVLAALIAATCLVVVGTVLTTVGSSGGEAPATARTVFATARAHGGAIVMFRDLRHSNRRGEIAVAPVGSPGSRTLAGFGCDRVYFAGGRGICIARRDAQATGYRVKVFGADLKIRNSLDVDGVPSRARVSPDGRYGTVTMFVGGHAYAPAGSFSTETTIIDMQSGTKLANLEDFTVMRNGMQVTAEDRNFWGVTFARNSDRFYATMATGGKTYLVAGSISSQFARTLHQNVECPSLSPDGTRIAYKSRTGSKDRPWRLTVLDLKTMRETPLAERQSVDDQAEWLDNDYVLYGLGNDVRSVRADGRGRPHVLAAHATSPAVVRF